MFNILKQNELAFYVIEFNKVSFGVQWIGKKEKHLSRCSEILIY